MAAGSQDEKGNNADFVIQPSKKTQETTKGKSVKVKAYDKEL